MKALRWHTARDVRYEDVPEPSPGPGMLKIKVSLAGICGTDLKEYTSGPILIPHDKVPLTMGHEFMGKVAEVGKGVNGFKMGDRVSGVGYYYCGECYTCRKGLYNLCVNQGFTGLTTDGCMAEYFLIPEYACYKLPYSVSDEQGALVEPLAVALHAVGKARLKQGDTVVIVGDGTIGLCSVLAAKVADASGIFLIAKHWKRGELGKRMGASAVINVMDGDPVRQLHELTGFIDMDAAIECAGRPDTPQLAIVLIKRGGTAVIVGIFEKPSLIDFSTITFTEKRIVGSSIYIDEGKTAIELMAKQKIDPSPLISSIVPLQDAVEKGFEALIKDKDTNVKVLLRPA
jgi:(R,R)-butanediol dehydrogenase/meso-butanediol dehydrogenase/diacetyl reductase